MLFRSTIDQAFNPYGIDKLPERASPISVTTEENKDPDFIAIKRVLLGCEWFRLYDLLQDIFRRLDFHDTELHDNEEEYYAYPFQEKLNEYFVHAGIGWQMADGKVIMRGDGAFEHTLQTADSELKASGRTTAAERIESAIRNLSIRPRPDFSGAVDRAANAMECVLQDITGEKQMTFGGYLNRYSHLFPGDLRKAMEGLWRYACNSGARHGKESVEPARDEAEFFVGVAAALTTFLNRKHPRS